MVVNQLPTEIMSQLHTLLQQMDVCAVELEGITQAEYEAIRALNADQIILLSDRRILAHQALAVLEKNCREMLTRHGVAEELTLEVIIDLHAGSQTADFQTLRRNLYERMIKISSRNQENHMRMHAAYNVSTNILQQLGLVQTEHTYGRRSGR